jgi:hypothetical protein
MSIAIQISYLWEFQNSIGELSKECVIGKTIRIPVVRQCALNLCAGFRKLQHKDGKSPTIKLDIVKLQNVCNAVMALANEFDGYVNVREMEDRINELYDAYAKLNPAKA